MASSSSYHGGSFDVNAMRKDSSSRTQPAQRHSSSSFSNSFEEDKEISSSQASGKKAVAVFSESSDEGIVPVKKDLSSPLEYSWVNEKVGTFISQFQTEKSIAKFRKSVQLTKSNRDDLVIVDPCMVSERVYFTALPCQNPYTYMYRALFEKLSVLLPFTELECKILTKFNVAPSQLHPNSWAFLRAFQILCGFLGINPTPKIFMYFYQLKSGVEIGWISLSGAHDKGLFTLYTRSFKGFKKDFFRVRPSQSHADSAEIFFDSEGKLKFPLYWQSSPRRFNSIDDSYLSSSESEDIEKLSSLPRPLNCKAILALPYSKEPEKGLNRIMKKFKFDWKSLRAEVDDTDDFTSPPVRPKKKKRVASSVVEEVPDLNRAAYEQDKEVVAPKSPYEQTTPDNVFKSDFISEDNKALMEKVGSVSLDSAEVLLTRSLAIIRCSKQNSEETSKKMEDMEEKMKIMEPILAKVGNLDIELAACKEKLAKSEEDLVKCGKSLIEATQAKEKLLAEASESGKVVATAQKQIDDLTRQLKISEKEKNDLHHKAVAAEMVANGFKTELEKLREELEALNLKNEDLTQNLDIAKRQIINQYKAGFYKAVRQAKVLSPGVNASLFDILKDVKDGQLIAETELSDESEEESEPVADATNAEV